MVRSRLLVLLAMATLIGGCAGVRQTVTGWMGGATPPAHPQAPQVFYAAADGLAVYAQPSSSSKLLGRLAARDKVTRSGLEHGYAFVVAERSGLEGWVVNSQLNWRIPSSGAGGSAGSGASSGATPRDGAVSRPADQPAGTAPTAASTGTAGADAAEAPADAAAPAVAPVEAIAAPEPPAPIAPPPPAEVPPPAPPPAPAVAPRPVAEAEAAEVPPKPPAQREPARPPTPAIFDPY